MRMSTTLVAAAIFFGWLNATALAQQAGTKIWDYLVETNLDVGYPTLGPDGTVYFLAHGLYAVSTNGTLKGKLPTPTSWPAITLDGTILVVSSGSLYAVSPNPPYSASRVFDCDSDIHDPVVGADGTIYFGTAYATLYAVNPDWSEKWRFALPAGSSAGKLSIATDGTIYFSAASKLYAITPQGTRKWVFPTAADYGYAALGKDGTVFVNVPGKLYALFPESTNPNGTKKWEFDGSSGKFAPVIAADGTIYIAGENSVLYAVKPNGTKKWEFQAGGQIQFTSAAIGRDGTVYVGCDDHFLYAINPDGSYKWSFETGGQVRSWPVIGADGTLYVGSGDGKLYAIKGDAVSDTSPWPMFGRDLRRSGRVTCPKGTPCFDTERMLTNGAFDMVLIGKAGATYGFDVSTNLTDWSRLTNSASANGAIRLVDDTATNYPCRFYRASPP
jgi:outer membrane protein assembly factor BamB